MRANLKSILRFTELETSARGRFGQIKSQLCSASPCAGGGAMLQTCSMTLPGCHEFGVLLRLGHKASILDALHGACGAENSVELRLRHFG